MKLLGIASALLGLVLSGSTSAQEFAAPDGLWEIESRDSRYDVTTCGDNGELCGKLIWLGNGADTAENLPYLNTFLINHASKVGPSQWAGQLSLFGQTAQGTITQFSDRNIAIEGCALMVICKTYNLYRVD